MGNVKHAHIGEPTPKPVLDAIGVIQDYLQAGGWVEAIISAQGGVAFRLTSIYEDFVGAFPPFDPMTVTRDGNG